MKIIPLDDIIQLEIEELKAGAFDLSSISAAVEYAKVVAIGQDVPTIKVGDHVFVKSWGIDIITHNKKRYYFVNYDTKAIVAIVKE